MGKLVADRHQGASNVVSILANGPRAVRAMVQQRHWQAAMTGGLLLRCRWGDETLLLSKEIWDYINAPTEVRQALGYTHTYVPIHTSIPSSRRRNESNITAARERHAQRGAQAPIYLPVPTSPN